MAGNATFESASARSSELGFSGSYLNGQRGIRSAAVGPNLNRLGNFREGSESRMFGSGFAMSRGGSSGLVASDDLHTLSQCLSLEPIVIGDQIRCHDELRRIMGIYIESTAKENSFDAAAVHRMPLPTVAAVKDLKRFRSSVVDTCVKARDIANKMNEQLHKLDIYRDFVSSKKQQRSELAINERAGAYTRMVTQFHNINQRVEDRPKNILLNKRVRTSVADSQAECQSYGLWKQPVATAKDGNFLDDNGGESDLFEKIRRLAAGGEGWDNKTKRKRSVGTVCTRSGDGDGMPKRAVQNKIVDERGLQHDTCISRLGSSNDTGGSTKSNTSAGLSAKNEQGFHFLPRDLSAGSNKERIVTKENSKLKDCDDYYTTCPSPVTKRKQLRTARMGSMMTASSSPGIVHVPRTLESWENAIGEEKIFSHDADSNRKRPMPLGSSSPPMAQWVRQRPQKMSRARRSNLVSPVSNPEVNQLSFERCSPSDISARLASNETNGPQKLLVKLDNIQSPLSESEESVGGENQSKDKDNGNRKVGAINDPNIGPFATLAKKNKPLINEEGGNGAWRQQRSGRGPPIARSSNLPVGNRSDKAATPRPLQSNKIGYKKNGSKSGRRLKRLSDQNGFSNRVTLQHSGSPDCTGGSDDDREELLAAAKHARIASHLACSSPFWKKMKPMFACVSSEDKSFLSQQIGRLHEDSVSDALPSGERNAHLQHHENESSSRRHEMDKKSKGFVPLYQRVLSALIIEDDIDELVEGDTRKTQVQNPFSESTYDTYRLNGSQPRERPRMENYSDTMFDIHAQSLHSVKKVFTSNGGVNSLRRCVVNSSVCEDVLSEVDQMCPDDKLLLELQSIGIGICPDKLPDLDDKEIETVQQEVDRLKTKLHQQEIKKNVYLEKICKGIESNSGVRDLETLAMDRLVELAYRKLLMATRRSSRSGVHKMPKQVALAFGKRTLDRCHKFEDSGTSCFNEPPAQDILFAPSENEPEPMDSVCQPVGNTKYFGYHNPEPVPRLFPDEDLAPNRPISNRGRKKELLLDDVGNAAIRAASYLGTDVTYGTKGKRSERNATKSGRASHGERKTKAKPRQKTDQPPTSMNESVNKPTGLTHPVPPSSNRTSQSADYKKDVSFQGRKADNHSMDLVLDDLDPIDELGLGGPQDLNSFLNFEEQDIEEDFAAGLDIPMDDLTELNMF